MRSLFLTATLATLLSVPIAAQQTGPAIASGGAHSPVPNPTFDVPKDVTYRVAWDIAVGSARPADANPAFEIPARFLNQSVAVGVPRSNIHVVIVVHGSAGEELLSNTEYRARKGADNPNITLLSELAGAGARIVICGQTVASRKIARDQLLPFVQVAPSATWALAVLHTQGFHLNPF